MIVNLLRLIELILGIYPENPDMESRVDKIVAEVSRLKGIEEEHRMYNSIQEFVDKAPKKKDF